MILILTWRSNTFISSQNFTNRRFMSIYEAKYVCSLYSFGRSHLIQEATVIVGFHLNLVIPISRKYAFRKSDVSLNHFSGLHRLQKRNLAIQPCNFIISKILFHFIRKFTPETDLKNNFYNCSSTIL